MPTPLHRATNTRMAPGSDKENTLLDYILKEHLSGKCNPVD